SVTDTGIGMKKELIKKLFIPFFTTKDINQGTGLGLSVVHGIITTHNGKIKVESEPGKGSTFRIFLGVADA
ncbi:MAG: HAMP domain-containing sensor histidine kinase, partial [Candidatus Cloacimonadaceae bacterium]|nr:HAMP domain-containing sensor histidine kinase [Candidatus Cloacimonadaceae bacterium]